MIKLSAFTDEAASSLEGQIESAHKCDLRYVDIRNINGKNIADFNEKEATKYYKRLAFEGIGVQCLGTPLGKSDVLSFNEFRLELEKMLKMCEAFQTDKIRFFSFYNYKGQESRIIDCIGKAVIFSQKYGVKLYHENELGIYGENADTCLKLINETGCECIYDPANFVLVGQDMEDAERKLADVSNFYHVKDARKVGEIVPAGKGDANLINLLKKDDKFLTIEPHLFSFDGYATLTEREMKKSEFCYASQEEAFYQGVLAVKEILEKNGYNKTMDGNWKKLKFEV